MKNMKQVILKAKMLNWSLHGPGSYDSISWEVYEDGSYQRKADYRDWKRNKGVITSKGKLSSNKTMELKGFIETTWPETRIDACDGTAWKMKAYNSKGEEKEFPRGYIYGLEVLENITKILPWPKENPPLGMNE